MLEEYGWELEEDIEEFKQTNCNYIERNELQDILIEEIKEASNNPLAN